MKESKTNRSVEKKNNKHHSTMQADQLERELQGDDLAQAYEGS
jgi:hypothetical protein